MYGVIVTVVSLWKTGNYLRAIGKMPIYTRIPSEQLQKIFTTGEIPFTPKRLRKCFLVLK